MNQPTPPPPPKKKKKKRKGDRMQGKNDKKDKLQQNPQVAV